jgi:hypothetical protein
MVKTWISCTYIYMFLPPPPNFHKNIQSSLYMSVPPNLFFDYKVKVSIIRPVTVIFSTLLYVFCLYFLISLAFM